VRLCDAVGILVLCLLARGTDAQTPANPFAGQPVVNITFDPPQQPLEPLEIVEILPVHRGDIYNPALVRASIDALFDTGRFEDIQVDASEGEGGVVLRFITRNSWFIGHIAVRSDLAEPPNPGQIASATRLELGSPFDEDQARAAEDNIRRLLTANGYFDADVTHFVDYQPLAQQARITFAISSGKRASYSTPSITGDTTVLSVGQITRATKWHRFLLPGYRGITQNRTRSGLDNIRLRYESANRLMATVTLDGIDPDTGQAHIITAPGPHVEVKAEGAKVSKKTLSTHVPIFEEHALDPDLLAEGSANLRDYFQSQGYFEAEADYVRQEESNGRTQIVYRVTLGPRHILAKVDVDGNKYFSDHAIRERLYIVPRSFEIRRGRYSEAFRRRDEQSIADLYHSNGFRDVKVTSRIQDDYNGKKGEFAVFFHVEEGPQYTVSFLRIEGNQKLDLSRTLQSLSSQAGQPYSEFSVASDRATILGEYGANGFADASFDWDSQVDSNQHTVEVTFRIREGEQQFVRQVVVTGLSTTRPALVNRQIELNPGEPLSPSAMADTQRRLYDLGVFAQVNTTAQNTDGGEKRKFVLYDVEEARRYSLTVGMGAQLGAPGGSTATTSLSSPAGGTGFSPRISLDASRLNFLGTAQSITFHGRLSTLQKRASLSYFVPRVFSLPTYDATFSLLYDFTHDVRTFRSERAEASAQIAHRYSKSDTFFYRFNYRDVKVSDLKIDPLLLPRVAQSVRVGIAAFNWVQDRRDDPTDPRKGVYNTLDAGLASKFFGSQTNFVRLLVRNSTYYRLGEKLVFARSTQFGVQPGFQVPPTADPTDPIPLPERFYGGGGSSMRGFPENQAGPRDAATGFPVGGSALLFNNLELRFPLFGSNIGGVLFEDAGNVYSRFSKISFSPTQKKDDFDYMVHAAGFGIRYRTPVGPVRFDLAYSINPPAFNGFEGNYVQLVQCSIAGNCVKSPQRISHFQFFFSIGQTF
jgi:outer membrane protein assembly complex protein YaeT